MAPRRTFSTSAADEPPATWFAFSPATAHLRANGVEPPSYAAPRQIRHLRSASSLTPEEHRKLSASSPNAAQHRSLVSLRPAYHLEEQRKQIVQFQRQRAGTFPRQEESVSGSQSSLQLALSSQQPEQERSKFFVRVSGLPSSRALTKGPILSNAIDSNPSGKLYEFIFPSCYKPVFLRPSFWQKCFKTPEYHVALLDSDRYMPEPIVILREAHRFAPPGRPWRSTEKDEQALHIATCHRDKVINIVQSELKRRSNYCSEQFQRALKMKKENYETNRDIAKRDLVWRDHKLMQIAADCAGDNGARGAKWLFDRLVRYIEFIGRKDGDEVVLRAAKLLVDDIQTMAKQVDISLSWKDNNAASAV